MHDQNRNKARRPDLEQAPRIQIGCSVLQVLRERKCSLVVRFGSDLFLLFKQTSFARAPFSSCLARCFLRPPPFVFPHCSSLSSSQHLQLRRRPPTHNFPPRRRLILIHLLSPPSRRSFSLLLPLIPLSCGRLPRLAVSRREPCCARDAQVWPPFSR